MKLPGALGSLYLMGFDRVIAQKSSSSKGSWFATENDEFQMMKQFSFSTPLTISPTPRKTSPPTTSSPTEGPTFFPTNEPTFLPTYLTSPPTEGPTSAKTPAPTDFVCSELETQDFSEYNTRLEELYTEVSYVGAFNGDDPDRLDALNFVRDERLCASPTRMVQRYISALFYFSTNGENWNAANFEGEEWLSPEHECEWGSLECTKDQIIDQISVDSSNLSGTIPVEICKLPLLEVIDLDDNKIRGKIPSNIGKCDNLRTLDLDNNRLVGSIPDTLFDLKLLEILDLDNNNLTGALSGKIGRFTELAYLSLFDNIFTGTIPQAIAKLENLQVIYLDLNEFTGTVSGGFCDRKYTDFTTDCAAAGQDKKVECSCCTNCPP
eukprot:CAMPEP_0194279496 /NCGR_PEP_ID=MMETSP0169-20130528/13962_1 /TAXON_ID=218684 /ORGANISM="Corethron pennatum, Strain L29A3" /LENGTH=378 /DNA_ID=CAMNT_0039023925 /DNA_START=70 /DNA_END=1206 /DNA_ORIENTATION=-